MECLVNINLDEVEVVEPPKKKQKKMSKRERKRAEELERLRALNMKKAANRRPLDEPIPSNDPFPPEPLAPHVFDAGGADAGDTEGGGEDCRLPTASEADSCELKSPPEEAPPPLARPPRRSSAIIDEDINNMGQNLPAVTPSRPVIEGILRQQVGGLVTAVGHPTPASYQRQTPPDGEISARLREMQRDEELAQWERDASGKGIRVQRKLLMVPYRMLWEFMVEN
mmetsp:Transcript_24537/g.55569  ORF Transcript_24537/g.55569 Transcript_24537/m.55569 type:complete len:226 (-) Transcript_24537:1144-1821(-)